MSRARIRTAAHSQVALVLCLLVTIVQPARAASLSTARAASLSTARAAGRPPFPVATSAASVPSPRVAAPSAVLMDPAGGQVLWGRAIHRRMLVASTTKILTALVAERSYPKRAVLVVPAAAEAVDGTRFGFTTGMRLTRDQLLTTLLFVSANDAAETLAAAYHPGGRAGFIARMQQVSEELHCTDSTWRDPSGLDVPGHKSSAADLAVLGRALLARPALAGMVRRQWLPFRWPGGRIQILNNHNELVAAGRDRDAIGIKTGFTVHARGTIVAAESSKGRVLIAVALGTTAIYADVRAMFAYGFALAHAPPDAEILGAARPPVTPAPALVATPATTEAPIERPRRRFPGAVALGGVLATLLGVTLIRRRRRARLAAG